MSVDTEKRMKEMEKQIVLLNEKTLLLLMSCIKHDKELSAVADILGEMVVGNPEDKDDMMASLARSSSLN